MKLMRIWPLVGPKATHLSKDRRTNSLYLTVSDSVSLEALQTYTLAAK